MNEMKRINFSVLSIVAAGGENEGQKLTNYSLSLFLTCFFFPKPQAREREKERQYHVDKLHWLYSVLLNQTDSALMFFFVPQSNCLHEKIEKKETRGKKVGNCCCLIPLSLFFLPRKKKVFLALIFHFVLLFLSRYIFPSGIERMAETEIANLLLGKNSPQEMNRLQKLLSFYFWR